MGDDCALESDDRLAGVKCGPDLGVEVELQIGNFALFLTTAFKQQVSSKCAADCGGSDKRPECFFLH